MNIAEVSITNIRYVSVTEQKNVKISISGERPGKRENGLPPTEPEKDRPRGSGPASYAELNVKRWTLIQSSATTEVLSHRGSLRWKTRTKCWNVSV